MRLSYNIFTALLFISLLFACANSTNDKSKKPVQIDFNFLLDGKKFKNSGLEYVGIPSVEQKDRVMEWEDENIFIKLITDNFEVGKYSVSVGEQPSKVLYTQDWLLDLEGLTGLTKIELCKAEECIAKYINILDVNVKKDNKNNAQKEVKLNKDKDGDGKEDRLDNCPSIKNTRQLDYDRDGIGDACDDDDDNDGIKDKNDLCPRQGDRGKVDANGCPKIIPEQSGKPEKPKDTDGDGFADSIDQCPDEFSKVNNGCPEIKKDSDGDGVVDKEDRCPQEGTYGNVDDKGCPIIKDTDGDGYSDDEDECPKIFSKTNKGCPQEKDTDNDGLIDKLDSCPEEGKKGEVDKNGCPYLNNSSSIIAAKKDCFKEGKKSSAIQLNFEVKKRMKLNSVELHTLSKWTNASITLLSDEGKIIGNRVYNERILPRSDISLLGIGTKLEKGKYILKIEGLGDAFDISECLSGKMSNSHLMIQSNSHFFNLVYKY